MRDKVLPGQQRLQTTLRPSFSASRDSLTREISESGWLPGWRGEKGVLGQKLLSSLPFLRQKSNHMILHFVSHTEVRTFWTNIMYLDFLKKKKPSRYHSWRPPTTNLQSLFKAAGSNRHPVQVAQIRESPRGMKITTREERRHAAVKNDSFRARSRIIWTKIKDSLGQW